MRQITKSRNQLQINWQNEWKEASQKQKKNHKIFPLVQEIAKELHSCSLPFNKIILE